MLAIHRAVDADTLVDALADVLAVPLADPFAPDLVAVPAKGVERWLAQRLSHVLGAGGGQDGVCARVLFPRPADVLDGVQRTASAEHARALDAWAPDRLVWPLLDLIDESAAEPWCSGLAAHLGTDGTGDKGRRYAVAAKLARLLDAYGQSRPAMLAGWAAGSDADGHGSSVPDDLAWQPEMFRLLREKIGPAPAELLDSACDAARDDPAAAGLPERLSVFGASRISPARLRLLAALAEARDVHVWIHHPSPALWDAVGRLPRHDSRRRHSADGIRNPLLASLSRDVRELQGLLADAAPDAEHAVHEGPPRPPTLLGRLQHGLASDSVPAAPGPVAPDDRSVQVHSCHGKARQVEVLRETVLRLLAQDGSLEPRDVLVMCPDVEAFAPLIAASFGAAADGPDAHPASRLRVRLADRALRQTNPLLGVLSVLLRLGGSRVTASQVLDLADTPVVRNRFGLDDRAVERVRGWVGGARVRWGLDAPHRTAWRLGGVAQGTWRDGLDRLLLGATMEEAEDHYGQAVPYDDVDSADIDLVGRLAELVDRLDAALQAMTRPRTAPEWARSLLDAVLSVAAPDADSGWQAQQLARELDEVADEAAASSALLTLHDVTALLERRLAGRPTTAGFRTGTLTVCTLVPMRSVPHRVVCLLGLDDGAFPRETSADGDDLLARSPAIGERDPRSEDRQLLLDAVAAARETLVITYTGADERTNARVPPAVPLGELLDALDRTADAGPGGRVRNVVTVRHPLQPSDPKCFAPGALVPGEPFSHDRLALAGARARQGPRRPAGTFLVAPLPAPNPRPVPLALLLQMVEHPARGFLRQRLDVSTFSKDEQPDDELRLELDGLQTWAVGERLLRARIHGVSPADCLAVEARRGDLPPGQLGDAVGRDVGRAVEGLLAAAASELAVPADAVDVSADLGGRLVAGTVPGIRGDVLLTVTYSKLAPKHRLRAWVQLLALAVSHPDRQWTAVSVGRANDGVQRSVLGGMCADAARVELERLVELRDAGQRQPLPMPTKTAAEYALRREKGSRHTAALIAAGKSWAAGRGKNGKRYPGEQDDADNALVWGNGAPLEVLLAADVPGVGDGDGWADDEPGAFGALARRVWSPLLAHEKITT